VKRFLVGIACLVFCIPGFAQNADEPASKDDVILLLRTMHSHDLLQKMMELQAQSMQQLTRNMLLKDKGSVPADFDEHFQKVMGDLIKGMPADEITQAMIPAYQAHFTHGDIEAMNTFYSSPVGQKVVQELPAVTQEGMKTAMPLLMKYLSEWQERMKHEFEPAQRSSPAKSGGAGAPTQN